MDNYFFPCLWSIPDFEENKIETPVFTVHKRLWDVTIFDLYSLVAAKHKLAFPAELMHVFLQVVNLEIETNGETFDAATDKADCIRAMFYLRGLSPTVMPFACNYSLNEYAGINDRSYANQSKMHEGLREGITHETARIQTLPHELSFSCIQGPDKVQPTRIKADAILTAAKDYREWCELEKHYKHLAAARRALVKAPLIPDVSASILHIWQGIESLFPNVSTEISFRISLLLAELSAPVNPRDETYKVAKKSYGDRSKIAHGMKINIDGSNWQSAWLILCRALNAILERKNLPSEDDLIKEVLART